MPRRRAELPVTPRRREVPLNRLLDAVGLSPHLKRGTGHRASAGGS